MSNALAIAGVTAVLKDLLDNALIDHSVNATVSSPVLVTCMAPDRVRVGEDERTQLNLFMYQVQPNQGWRNVGLPSRDGNGQRLTNAPLALDLYYLLTAYGARDFEAEVLLGYAMQMFHETPFLTRDAIRRALNPQLPLPSPVVGPGLLPPLVAAIASSELADQIEQIKITPQSLSTEEMSKLWTATMANFRPSVVYLASVVLIESRRPTRAALPVLTRNILALPFSPPIIEAVEPQIPVFAPGLALTLRGANLLTDDTVVQVGPLETTPAPGSNASRLVVTLPAGLPAGLNEIQVTHRVDIGTPPPRRLLESNPAVFILRPFVARNAANNYEIAFTDRVDNGDGTLTGRVTVNLIQPDVGRDQRAALLLNQTGLPPGQVPRHYRAEAPPRPANTASLSVPVRSVAPGTYLVRVQVEGAESPLEVDGGGAFSAPTVTIV